MQPRAKLVEQYGCLADDEIVARVLEGDTALYELIMRRYNQRLYRAIRAILKNESEVEDALQETYLSAYRKLASFEGRARFSTWLTRIAVNLAIDRRRRRMRVSSLEAAQVEAEVERRDVIPLAGRILGPEAEATHLELARLLASEIDRLPDHYRSVYVLREIEGMNVEETSQCLDLARSTVKTRLHRARTLLRDALTDRVGASAEATFTFAGKRCDGIVNRVLAHLQGRP